MRPCSGRGTTLEFHSFITVGLTYKFTAHLLRVYVFCSSAIVSYPWRFDAIQETVFPSWKYKIVKRWAHKRSNPMHGYSTAVDSAQAQGGSTSILNVQKLWNRNDTISWVLLKTKNRCIAFSIERCSEIGKTNLKWIELILVIVRRVSRVSESTKDQKGKDDYPDN